MTLTIEDGSGIDGADSYATAAEFIAWSLDLMGDTVTADDSALRRAFVYMGGLDWKPDTAPTFGGTIPQAVKSAQCAFARAEATQAGYLSPDVTLSGRKVLTGVDSLTWQVQSAPNTVDAARPVVSMALDYLKPYLRKMPGSSSSSAFLERA